MQALLDVHDTRYRLKNATPWGLGVVWIDQLVPFHCSASVPVLELPTAVHAVLDVHDTPESGAPDGLGVVWIDQLVPFHCSASVPVLELPTAVHAVLDVHDTPESQLEVAPDGLGVVWSDQLVPFHCSASVASVKELVSVVPTAVQRLPVLQDTSFSEVGGMKLGLGGVVWSDQLLPFQCSAKVPLA
jgi:hypothetical protein